MAILLAGAIALAVLGGGWIAYRAAGVFRTQYADFHPSRSILPLPAASGAPVAELSLRLASGTVVKGWRLPSTNGASVVFLHGSPGDRRSLFDTALALNRHGYGALVLDAPGHGESTGKAIWDGDTLDALRAAVEEARKSPQGQRLALVGYSMGSSIAARVAAADPRVDAVILLAPFTDLAEQLRHQYRHRIPGLSEAAVLATRFAGVPVAQMRSLEAVQGLGKPLMIIAGELDRAIPLSMPGALFAAAGEPKVLWVVRGAGHADARQVAGPVEFDGRIRDFLDASLFGPGGKTR
jgi:pimeloyl-ACP methyl ester carboxylesterase